MEMFLYFSLKFQFPIPDPSVCGTIYSIPFKTSQGGGDKFLFQVEYITKFIII